MYRLGPLLCSPAICDGCTAIYGDITTTTGHVAMLTWVVLGGVVESATQMATPPPKQTAFRLFNAMPGPDARQLHQATARATRGSVAKPA
eukprot:1219794-Rhodomonas_salina.1